MENMMYDAIEVYIYAVEGYCCSSSAE